MSPSPLSLGQVTFHYHISLYTLAVKLQDHCHQMLVARARNPIHCKYVVSFYSSLFFFSLFFLFSLPISVCVCLLTDSTPTTPEHSTARERPLLHIFFGSGRQRCRIRNGRSCFGGKADFWVGQRWPRDIFKLPSFVKWLTYLTLPRHWRSRQTPNSIPPPQ